MKRLFATVGSSERMPVAHVDRRSRTLGRRAVGRTFRGATRPGCVADLASGVPSA